MWAIQMIIDELAIAYVIKNADVFVVMYSTYFLFKSTVHSDR
jgi:hypothetical protein